MSTKFNNNLLRRSAPPELAAHLLALLKDYPEREISAHLFRLAKDEALSPNVFSVWLRISASPETLLQALEQEFSVSIRFSAIKRLAKALETSQWREVWLAIGGTSGLSSLLARFSVAQVKAFFKCTKLIKGPDAEGKRKAMSDLLQGPFPSIHSKAVQRAMEQKTPVRVIQHTPIHGYSKPMLVALDLLRQAVAQTDNNVENETVLWRSTVESLVRKAYKRRRSIGWERLEELFLLCFRFLDAFPEVARHLEFGIKTFSYYVVLFWAFSPPGRPSFTHGIISVFQKISYDESAFWSRILPVIPWVRRARRYDLLRLVLLHYGKRNIDIENDKHLKGLGIGKWPQTLFCELDQDSALQLLHRLLRINGDDFLAPKTAPQTHSILDVDSDHGDVSILLGVLGEPEGAEAGLHKHMSAAARSREQSQRASHALSALFHSIATRSIKLYGDTMEWARRYIRDPLTSMIIFRRNTVKTEEGIALLSGIPNRPDTLQQLGSAQIGKNVIESNKVILEAMKTVLLAMKEPSFQLYRWSDLLTLISDVVEIRLHRTGPLQQELKLSDDQVYELVWSDTLSLAIQLEKISLEPGLETILDHYGLKGPVKFTLDHIPTVAAQPYLRFVDNLAKERDNLWTKYRRSISPIAATLPRALPRGLSLQYMLGDGRIGKDWPAEMTPFISSRAEKVVFSNPSDVLGAISDDDEVRSAIGPLIDSFSLALKIFVGQDSSSEECVEKRDRAWTHALENLSRGRLSAKEAHRFWIPIFQNAGINWDLPAADPPTRMEYPRLPLDENPAETVEWDPADFFKPPPAAESRLLDPTYLDCMINAPPSWRFEAFQVPTPRTIAFHPPGFNVWLLSRQSKRTLSIPAVREGVVVSALLYLDSKTKGQRSILTTAFPSPSEPRYPSLYLAEEFLQRHELEVTMAQSVIGNYVDTIPPTLLMSLTRAALDDLSKQSSASSQSANVEHLALDLLSIATQCDRPQDVIDLVIGTIIDRPDSSSWHRQLMGPKFLNRLSVIHVRYAMRKFATAILEKVREQTARRQEVAAGKLSDASPVVKRSYVKITTIKLLAGLLTDSAFASEDFTIEVLSELLRTPHLDVRAAAVGSLLRMLAGCLDESRGNKVISALEIVIPIAGSMNERTQISEEEWKQAVDTKTPPEVSGDEVSLGSSGGILPPAAPILDAIMAVAMPDGSHNYWNWPHELMTRILLPIIKHSIASNTRWLEISAAKHRINLKALDIPMLPANPDVLLDILRQYDWYKLPSSLLELYHRFVMTNLSPSQALRKFRSTLDDVTLRNLPETRHWTMLYGGRSEQLLKVDPYICFLNYLPLALRVEEFPADDSPDDIRLPQVMEYAFAQAKVLLFQSPMPTLFLYFMEEFQYRSHSFMSEETEIRTFGHGRLIVQRIITFIESLRTPEWQNDPDRHPAILPPTLKYRLRLLPYPPPLPTSTSHPDDAKLAAFVQAIAGFAKELYSEDKPYHEEFLLLRGAALEVEPYYRADVACALGRLDGSRGLEKLLCIEIAQALFESAEPPRKEETAREAGDVISSWRRSEVEAVRMKGVNMGRRDVYKDEKWRDLLLGVDGRGVLIKGLGKDSGGESLALSSRWGLSVALNERVIARAMEVRDET